MGCPGSAVRSLEREIGPVPEHRLTARLNIVHPRRRAPVPAGRGAECEVDPVSRTQQAESLICSAAEAETDGGQMVGERDRLEVFQDRRGHWRWRRHDETGEVVGAASEGYASREDCERNMTRGPCPSDKWDFYIDRRGRHRWRRYAMNGRVIGAASRGFPTRKDAEDNARRQGYEG
jgi:uncharacterized protein YegP (UPF0339 family)